VDWKEVKHQCQFGGISMLVQRESFI